MRRNRAIRGIPRRRQVSVYVLNFGLNLHIALILLIITGLRSHFDHISFSSLWQNRGTFVHIELAVFVLANGREPRMFVALAEDRWNQLSLVNRTPVV